MTLMHRVTCLMSVLSLMWLECSQKLLRKKKKIKVDYVSEQVTGSQKSSCAYISVWSLFKYKVGGFVQYELMTGPSALV